MAIGAAPKMVKQEMIAAALEFGVDLHGRRIFLHGEVDEVTIGRAIRGLYLLADQNQKPIELYVSSYGGALDEAFALHDVTRTIRAPVHTVALGKCMSAAPILVACGMPGSRYVTENCQFMLHDCSLGIEGSPALISRHVNAAQATMQRMAELLAKYSRMPVRHWKRIFSSQVDKFFDSELALSWGIVDHIWTEKD